MNIQQYVYAEESVNVERYFKHLSKMSANKRRRKNDHNALLGYILRHGLGQFQKVILLNHWLESRPLNKALSPTW